eukprot:TRINITY_DN4618_c1_g1_i1.p1 TRINITY_DN4618_c1_g1~~TRINITY_DN4618_c1_g1_i1.p1  ORF type:complete len:299 (-),score=62.47 TRINITY_DN4618_c1_g1_i1:1092-1988(-)
MENLPIDIILIRHGESEGNLAQFQSKKGDDTLWTSDFSQRHTSNYRLTDRGREQANVAGEWIKKNLGEFFDSYWVSEYIRAQETAALLNFKNAKWHCEFYLREQDKGILAGKSHTEREKEYSDQLEKLKKDSFYVAPPGGESMANSCLRVDRIISMWQTSCPGQKIVCVCHGNIMTAFRVRLERMSQSRYQEIQKSNNPQDKIQHCQIFHYTRRNPDTGEIEPIPLWMKSICPWDVSLSKNEWEQIVRPVFTTESLIAEVNKVPQLINNENIKRGQKKTKEEEDAERKAAVESSSVFA